MFIKLKTSALLRLSKLQSMFDHINHIGFMRDDFSSKNGLIFTNGQKDGQKLMFVGPTLKKND